MKFDEQFDNITTLEEVCGMLNTYTSSKCCVCGENTDWFDMEIEKPVCSTECRKVINPNAKS